MARLDTLPTEMLGLILSYFIPTYQGFEIQRADAATVGQVRRLTTRSRGVTKLYTWLLINRSITDQVLDILYGSNVFTFHDPWLIETFMIRIGQANLDRIAQVAVQAGPLTKVHNDKTTTTLFSIISTHFRGLQTLRIVGVGRGNTIANSFHPDIWLPSHLERIEFITSLPGSLNKAKVYCDVEENNTRLLCNGAKYKKDADEVEVDMECARDEMRNASKTIKKRKALAAESNVLQKELVAGEDSTNDAKARKRPKVKPTYMWKG